MIKKVFLSICFIALSVYAENPVPSLPYITGDGFRSIADFILDETVAWAESNRVITLIKDGDIIFLKTDYLASFFSQVHPRITKKYILITHNSDYSAPQGFKNFLDDPKLIAWFAQNADTSHPKLFPIPIGLENERVRLRIRKISCADVSAICTQYAHVSRDILLYMNFAVANYAPERAVIYNYFISQPYCFCAPAKSFKEYMQDVARSKFVLSPRGNGEDCHRTWEALLMGAIPIVKSSYLDSMYAELPVIIIQDWQSITKEFLQGQYEHMQSKNYNHEKMFMPYWKNLIYSMRAR